MKNIILIGMMSSGKSTLGKKLSRSLGYRFVDLDKLIEKDQGSEITAIFAEKGENYFREVESKILKQITPNSSIVLAAGGGTPCFYDNMAFIKNLGISIFLDVPAANLAKRIESHGKDDRPVLSGAHSIEEALMLKINERLPYYSQADFIIKGEIDVDNILELIQVVL